MPIAKPRVLFLSSGLVSLIGCGASPSATSPGSNATSPSASDGAASDAASELGTGAIGNAYTALTAGQTEKVDSVIQSLDALVASQPKNQQALFFSGVMRLWQIGDNLTPSLNQAQVLEEAETAIARLDLAHSLNPNDNLALGFDGLANALIGRRIADSDKVDAGVAELNEGIARLPAYTHFLRALVAADNQDFPTAISHMYATLDACGEPYDGGTVAYVSGSLDPSRISCNDEGVVPHVVEGFFITFGDFLLRGGAGAEQARIAYRSAQNAPTYNEWPFASELEAKIAHADEVAAAYADGGADAGPVMWPSSGHLCIGCHQKHP